jgi:hypothetical protein
MFPSFLRTVPLKVLSHQIDWHKSVMVGLEWWSKGKVLPAVLLSLIDVACNLRIPRAILLPGLLFKQETFPVYGT